MKKIIFLLVVVHGFAYSDGTIELLDLSDDIISAATAIDDRFDRAVAAYKELDYFKAQELLCTLIDEGKATAQVYLLLGHVYGEFKKYTDAAEQYRFAIALDPHLIRAYDRLYHLYNEQHLFELSVEVLKLGLTHNKNDLNLQFMLANTYNVMDLMEEALSLYLSVNEQHPNTPAVLYNIAYTYKKLGKVDKALSFYNKVLAISPDHADAQFGRGVAYLTKGRLEKGWPGYEWRWNRENKGGPPTYNQPWWDGGDLHGKKIYFYAEQGLGDTFQFIRYVKIAKEKGAEQVIVAVQKPLVDIARLCPYIDIVLPLGRAPVSFDVHAPLASLPHIFKTRIDTVPNSIPYLYADEDLVIEWYDKLEEDTNIKIGICWNGNSNYHTSFLRAVVANKSLLVQKFKSIADIESVSLYSLQKMTGMDQLNNDIDFELKTFGDDFDESHGRFMDTAAVMKNLDLVITVDTSIAHLAGGLGVPVWVMLPYPADWRWMLDRNDSPWYPNMRLFRQDKPKDWDTVIERVATELRKYVLQRRTRGSFKGDYTSWSTLLDDYYMMLIMKENAQTESAQKELDGALGAAQEAVDALPPSDIRDQLAHHLYTVNKKRWQVGKEIQNAKNIMSSDKEFMDQMQQFVALQELHRSIMYKIDALMCK